VAGDSREAPDRVQEPDGRQPGPAFQQPPDRQSELAEMVLFARVNAAFNSYVIVFLPLVLSGLMDGRSKAAVGFLTPIILGILQWCLVGVLGFCVTYPYWSVLSKLGS
jgi:hypothetical protein